MSQNAESSSTYGVYEWLNAYTTKIDNMTEQEKREENRLDYMEESQLYADYLDYVEEWEWHQKEQKHALLQSFILAQSKHHRKMECTCEQASHVFTTLNEPQAGDVITDSPAVYIYGKCWYRVISSKVDAVLNALKQPHIKLPKTLEGIMLQVARWRMVTKDQTPFLLPYDAFEKIWWSKTSTGKESDVAKQLLSQLNGIERDQIQILKNQSKSTIPKEKRKKLLDFPHSDHGMHALKAALSTADFDMVWSFMNRWRNKIHPRSSIRIEQLEEKIAQCKICNQHREYPPVLSNPGIYYAPPGCGKSTAQDKEIIVGYDTDWTGIGPGWEDYSPLLAMKIPIITNQYSIFDGCGIKVIGIMKREVRKDTRGNPLTTMRELRSYESAHMQDVIFMYVKERTFMSHYATELQIVTHLQHMIRNYAINLLPFYMNEMSPDWLNKYPKLLRKHQA